MGLDQLLDGFVLLRPVLVGKGLLLGGDLQGRLAPAAPDVRVGAALEQARHAGVVAEVGGDRDDEEHHDGHGGAGDELGRVVDAGGGRVQLDLVHGLLAGAGQAPDVPL